MNKQIKCIVAGTNSNGEPDLFPIIVNGTENDFNTGKHYDAARDAAADCGYEPHLCFDENDAGGRMMLPIFKWETIAVVTI